MPNETNGVLVPGKDPMRIKGLMYADDVVTLCNSNESVQRSITGIFDWGRKYGMELGCDKCGVLLCKGKDVAAAPRTRVSRVLDFEDDDEVGKISLAEIYESHKEAKYGTPEGAIPTVDKYKYLGITVDDKLGDSRLVAVDERSMEYKFALLQSKKGMRQLHLLRPFLTDRFCPVHLKVALVRNLIYPTMLYGAEFIGFQKLHADPLQRVINIAVKWILGLHRSNMSTDAFTLSYELGLLPLFLETSTAHARLGCKIKMGQEKLHTWIQKLFDNPATYSTRHLTWVTQTKKWLQKVESEKHKYAWVLKEAPGEVRVVRGFRIEEEEETPIDYYYNLDIAEPLCPWAQIGRVLEMRVCSNTYQSAFMDNVLAELTGELHDGGESWPPYLDPNTGVLDLWWNGLEELREMGEGLVIPVNRMKGEAITVLCV